MRRKFLKGSALALLLVLVTSSAALGDNVVAEISADPKAITIDEGQNTVVDYKLVGTNDSDVTGNEGCNATSTNHVFVTLQADAAGVSISPNPVEFAACNSNVAVTFTGDDAGVYAMSVQSVSGGISASYNTTPANWTLTVNEVVSENAAPVITSAVFDSASVDCRVSDDFDVAFTDADSSSWTAEIDWDYDGTTFTVDQGPTSVTSPFTASHTYNAPGTYTAAVRITDNHGNTSDIATDTLTVTQEYTVAFLSPFDTSNAQVAVINKAKAGRTVPVKATIFDVCAQQAVTDPDGTLSPKPTIAIGHASTANGSSTDTIEAYADAGAANSNTAAFRWSLDGFWIYNYSTTDLSVGQSYRIDIYIGGVKATDDQWALLAAMK